MINRKTQHEVKPGDILTDDEGTDYKVCSLEKPRHPGSSGRLYVHERHQDENHTRGVFPHVLDCEWIEREDRKR